MAAYMDSPINVATSLPPPAALVTVQLYSPASDAITMVMLMTDDVSFKRNSPLRYHWKEFPGPPPDSQVNISSSDWLVRIIVDVTLTRFLGDTEKRE